MVRMSRPDGGECRVHESRVEEYRKLGHLVAEETGRDAPLSGGASGTPPHPSAAPTPLAHVAASGSQASSAMETGPLPCCTLAASAAGGASGAAPPRGEGRGAAKGKAGKRKEATGHE